jgi:hypothetical protein
VVDGKGRRPRQLLDGARMDVAMGPGVRSDEEAIKGSMVGLKVERDAERWRSASE